MILNRLQTLSVLIALFTFLSCNKDTPSDVEVDGTINVSSIVDGQIIDEAIQIVANIDGNDTGNSIEVFIDSKSIYSAQNESVISLDFDPDAYTTGPHILKIVLTDANGNTVTKEVRFQVHRRLVTINLPDDMVNQYIINAVAFASKMDGSLISAKQFTNADKTITLSSSEEFGANEEFMLTFALTDNGTATGMSTHANLTRNNPGTINLTKPFRGIEGEIKTYPAFGFESNDVITSNNINEPYNSDYRLQLNVAEETFTVTIIDDIDVDLNAPDIFYMYGFEMGNYQYLTLYPPLANEFILDKADFTSDGVESRNVVLNSSQNIENKAAFMNIHGYWKESDFNINNFHLIYHRGLNLSVGNQFSYDLNTNFYNYRYSLGCDNYYAAGTGEPKANFTIPQNTLDFTYSNNKVDFDITGTNHIIGRIRLFDLDVVAPIYVWDITFNSQTTKSIFLPQLPNEMEKSNLLNLYANNLMEVSSTELVSYGGINDYDEYLQKVIRDHNDPLQVTEGQELIYKGNGPFHDGPIEDFPFQ